MPKSTAIRSRIVRIGNSQGIRLPKPLIEQAGLSEEVELRVEHGQIVIAAPRLTRAGWSEAALRARTAGDDQLEAGGATNFDETEWEWR
jgi:antitoxin MazE